MATCLDVIKRALKKINSLPAGTEPTGDQASDGMDDLQSLVSELIGQGTLGRLNDVLATTDYTAREYDRIQISEGVTVTLPTVIDDACGSPYPYLGDNWAMLGPGVGYWDYGADYSGPNRPPRNMVPVVTIDSTGEEIDYVWNTYQGEWVQIQALTQQSAWPFPNYLLDGFACLLAERIAEQYGQPVGPQTTKSANYCRFMLSTNMDSASPTANVLFF